MKAENFWVEAIMQATLLERRKVIKSKTHQTKHQLTIFFDYIKHPILNGFKRKTADRMKYMANTAKELQL